MRLAFVLVTLVLLAPVAAHARCAPGKYVGTAVEEGQAPNQVLVTIECDGDAVRGQIESPLGAVPITGGEASADHWRVEATADTVPITAEARRQGDAWTGSYTLGPSRGVLALQRDDSAVYAQGSDAPENLELTTEQWRADLAALAEQIPAQHKNAFHHIPETQWRAAVAELDARLSSLSDEEVPVAFLELAKRVGDGHTGVRLPSAPSLPIVMFQFGDELRITRTSQQHASLLGARVLRIGDAPIRDAERRVAQVTAAAENRWSRLATVPYLLRRRDVLVYYKLAPAAGPVRFRVQLANGRRTDVDIAFEQRPTMEAYVGGEAPIWRQRPGESLWSRELPGSILYANFRNYQQLRTHAQALMAEVDRLQPAKFVLDMRDNEGGDFTVFRDSMLAAILERPWLNRRDRLYVLIGREMFSAAMTNAADLRLRTNATLVGEPIGERPNSYQEVRFFYLPNSNLRFGVSTQFYEALPGAGDPDAVEPHVSRPPTWKSFARGQDDALEWVRRE